MLTITSVQKQLKEIGESNRFNAFVAKEGYSRQFDFLNNLLPYLKTGPSEEYVRAEIERLTKQKDIVVSRFETWKKSNPSEWESRYYSVEKDEREREMKRIFSDYKALMGMTAINRHIKYLSFILNSESTVVKDKK